jgi:putative hydrolases of HD superfamily
MRGPLLCIEKNHKTNSMKPEELLPFLKEVDRLKTVERQALLHNGGRRENSAEHSWHLAIAVLLFHSFASEKVDLLKALKMALLHDIVEIDAGDTFAYDVNSDTNTKELEAIKRLTGLLPKELGESLKEIWLEFEEGQSPEAKLVKGLDRFLPAYSNILNEGHTWKKHGITLTQVLGKNQKPIETGVPSLWPVFEKMLNEAVSQGHLKNN